ncbi:CHASE2 domain-containing protein [Halomonas sp. MCCC 1A17488]|uniref:CHASE2 domain-containing protein n=1 Tax=unclassified Halomonas TaxID=2609666 RepID=UPI0018D23DC5|nr:MULTISPECIES: CHASE2 domain-containing protein [unclassified Halomonas]MCE8014820.1 CHASE2 domain-containing protein [Halomonas sp. MCCC 1A17488]MCG3238153.1 CHASE2 domain-containing protein [Halomonas sp. MCCC 1A17488]QPP48079.1 CHASE2 domain-containing protein [Halomonas sp. SS10-MC5]
MARLERIVGLGHSLRHRCWQIAGVRYLVYVALGIWALAADPFTLSSTSDRALSREYQNLHVRLSGVEPAPLTVVMIDAPSIQALHGDGSGWMSSSDWPLDYADHARLITDLTDSQAHPPSALFYDIFFEAPRSASGDLGRLGSRLSMLAQDGPTKLLLAGGGSPMPMSLPSYELLAQPQLAPTSWHGHGDDYPFLAAVPLLNTTRGDVRPTPAVAVYQALCEASNRSCDWLEPTSASDLSVQWASREAPECVPAEPVSRSGALLKRFAQGVLQGLYRKVEPSHLSADCLPVNLVRASQLYGDDPVSLVPPELGEGAPYAVMVGVVMPSMLDYVATPIYEQLPGVMLHAVAFENLWRLESGYFRYRDVTLWGIAAWCLAVLLFMLQAQRRHVSPPRTKIPLVLIWWGVITVAVLLLQLVFHNLMRIVPEGWLSLIAVVPLLREVVLRNEAATQPIKETNDA